MGLFDDLIPASGGRTPIPQVGRALLDTIAGGEANGYDVVYGGGRFDDFSDHPRRAVPISSGPNAGKTSSAAGRYQFLGSTWDEVRQEAGLPDFSPDSQDQGAWHLANKTYKTKTGRDLTADLEKAQGNPAAIKAIGGYLSGVWTSLPGGIEPNKATGSFVSRYDGASRQPTEMSSQARRPAGGLFDDLIPASSSTFSRAPETGPPVSDALPPQDTGGRFTDTAGENFRTAREGVSPSMGRLEAFGAALGQGATANFMDEFMGAEAAGKAGIENKTVRAALPPGATHLAGLARLGYEMLTGNKGAATEAYERITAEERDRVERAKTQYPGTALTGEITGSLVAPGGAVAKGASLPLRMGASALAAAGYGGLSGAGEGTDAASRTTGAAAGTGTGLAFGAAAPVAIGAVGKAAQGVSKLAAPLVQAVRGIRDPEAEAARRVVGALQRDAKTGSAGMDTAEFAAERAAGTPVVIGDMGGAATQSLARSAANTSTEGRAALELVTSDRYASQNSRTATWLKDTFDFPDPGAKLDQIHEAARLANRPAYMKAYKEGAAGIWDEGLEQFSQAPVMQDAIRAAFLTARNKAATDGFPPIKNPFELNKATGVFELKANPDGSRNLPNLQFWDHVKRNLDKVNSPESRAAAQALRNHLDEIVPSYKDARSGAAGWFGAEDALEAGAKFATMGGLDAMKLSQARAQLAKMSAPDRKLFETGFVSNLIARVESRTDGQDIVKNVFNSDFARKQIELAVGKDKAAMLEAKLQTERVMNGLKGALGNSTTARQLYELGMAGATHPGTLAAGAAGATAYGSGSLGPGDAFAAGLVFAARKGQIKIDERIAKHVGKMLASNDVASINKGLQIVARNDGMKRALRLFDAPVARTGTEQTRDALPALQGPVTGRAEDDQPN